MNNTTNFDFFKINPLPDVVARGLLEAELVEWRKSGDFPLFYRSYRFLPLKLYHTFKI